MSYEQLAIQMERRGCPIQASAIFKIEKGRPNPRRITVDELVALGAVFGLEVEELLRPLESVLSEEVAAADDRAADAFTQLGEAIDAATMAQVAYAELRKRAAESGSEDLRLALEARDAELTESFNRRIAESGGGSGIQTRLDEFARSQSSWTDAELSEYEAVHDATQGLFDAIWAVTHARPWER